MKLGSLGGPAAPPANGMWPSMKAGAAKLSEDENDDATVPEIAESSQSESALAIAQSEQFLAGLKLGMAARRTVAGEKAPGGQRVKGPARVDEGVQTEGVPGDGGPGDSGTAVGEGRQGTSEKGAKQSSFFREGGQRAFDPDVALRREAGGGADENGERDGVTDERGPGKRVWNPFRRAGGLAPGGGQGPEGGKEREHETEGGDPEADSERKQGNAEPPAVCAANETSEGDFDLQPSIPESPGEAGTESANDGEPSRHEVAALNSYQNGVPEANRDDRTSEDVSAQMLPQADANGTEEEDDGDQSQGGNLNSVHSEEATNCGNNEAEHSSLVGDPPGEVSSPDVPPAVENEGYGATEKHESGAVSPNQSRRGTRRGGEQPAADTESLPKVFERLTSNRFKSSVPATLDLTAPSVVLVLDTERGDLSPVSPGPRSPDLRIGGSPLPRLKRSESLSETVQRRREKAERRKTHGEFLRLSAAIYEVPPPKDRHGQSGGIAEEVPSTVPESPLPGGASPELPATPQEESNPSPSDQRRNSEKRWADEWDLANAKWQADVQRLQEENARARAQVDERERARQGALEEVAALRAELERMRAEALAVKESAQIPQGKLQTLIFRLNAFPVLSNSTVEMGMS